MAKKYISFLGLGMYRNCRYYFDKSNKDNLILTQYLQVAVANHVCMNWTQEDSVIIFATCDAKQRAWEGQDGLEQALCELGCPASIKCELIPDCKSEHEIWKTFETIYNSLQNEDLLYIDITYGFRSIPMLCIVMINYARVMKNVTLERIYYGAFDAKEDSGVENEPNVPVFDLTTFQNLMWWTLAVDRFISGGEARSLRDVTMKEIDSVLSATRGKDVDGSNIKDFVGRLDDFMNAISTSRMADLLQISKGFKERADLVRSVSMPCLVPLVEKLEGEVNAFDTTDDFVNCLEAAKWCYKYGRIQQGYTILQEGMKSKFIQMIGEPSNNNNKSVRELVSQAAHIHKAACPKSQWKEEAKNNEEIINQLLDVYRNNAQLIRVYNDLSGGRNDLNHAGYTQNPQKHKKLAKELSIFIKRIEDALA